MPMYMKCHEPVCSVVTRLLLMVMMMMMMMNCWGGCGGSGGGGGGGGIAGFGIERRLDGDTRGRVIGNIRV